MSKQSANLKLTALDQPGLRPEKAADIRPILAGQSLIWLRAHWVGLALLAILMAAALLRLFVLYKSHFIGDGDEALTGVMARHILAGERPIFTYGQTYMAATEAYFTAGWFALFGFSSWAMKIGPLLAALALVALNYAVARYYTGSRLAGLLAATLTAFPSLYFLVIGLRAWNHSTETMVGGDLLLLTAWFIVWGTPPKPEDRRIWGITRRQWVAWGLLGLVVGVSFYGHMLAIFYYVPVIFFLFLKDKLFMLRPTVLITLAGFLVGSWPWWLYNLTNQWATLAYFFKPNDTYKEPPLRVLTHYADFSWPLATGAYNYWFNTAAGLGILLNLTFLVSLVGWLFVRRSGLVGWLKLSLAPARPVDLLLLMVLCSPVIYLLWGAGNVAFTPLDTTGRYLLPLIGILPVMLGGGLARLAEWLPGRWDFSRARAVTIGLVVVVMVGVVGSNVYLYSKADYVVAFQSPYFPELKPPVDNIPLIAYLKSQQIEYATCNHWVGNRIVLESAEAVKCVDYHDLSIGGLDRFPDYSRAIEQPGLRVAFVLLNLSDGSVPLEQRLKELGVAYSRQEFLPYIVIIPTSRPVSPREVVEQLHYPL